MPWTELYDQATGKTTRFFLEPPGKRRTETVYVGSNYRGGAWCRPVVFGVRYNVLRYGEKWQEQKVDSRARAEQLIARLKRKGYRQFEIVEYREGKHEINV